MARIYTRTGDTGQTGLSDGSRVSKADLRVEAYGTVDELNSWLGLVIAQCDHEDIGETLTRIQSELFDIGAQLAAEDPKYRAQMPIIHVEQITQLEQWIDAFEQELEPLRLFILPGGNLCAAHIHNARAVCRRAERRLVALMQEDSSLPGELLRYLNRLSDLLFVLARVQNRRHGVS